MLKNCVSLSCYYEPHVRTWRFLEKMLSTILMKRIIINILCSFIAVAVCGQTTELLSYGNMNTWVTRDIKESHIIGGAWKKCYAVGPEKNIKGDEPYRNMGGSPWASSNVMAKVVGITKVSNAVFPEERAPGDRCAKLTTMLERCKAVGIINIDVLVAGTLFLGEMMEPIRSTSDPYSKMEVGMPFSRRPMALVYDYKLDMPADGKMIYSSGFGKKKELPGRDKAEVLVILQRRWEDREGGLHARRVGTGRELLGTATKGWKNGHKLPIHYGDISREPYFRKYMGLIPEAKSYYARNSKGEMVPVVEEGWDTANAVPTHLIVMFSSGSGEPYTGTPGTTLYVDNVGLAY